MYHTLSTYFRPSALRWSQPGSCAAASVLALTRLSGEATQIWPIGHAPSVCVVEGGLKWVVGNTGGIWFIWWCKDILGGGFECFLFITPIWGKIPIFIWTYFSNGLKPPPGRMQDLLVDFWTNDQVNWWHLFFCLIYHNSDLQTYVFFHNLELKIIRLSKILEISTYQSLMNNPSVCS